MARQEMTYAEWVQSNEWRGSSDVPMPMLPAFIHDMMPLLLEDDLSVVRVAHVIAKEQVLATRVLRLANSAYSSPMHEITTLNDAIVRMGTTAVRNVAFAVCFAARLQAGDAYGPMGVSLADHAVGTAYLARLVAERVGVDPDEAFVHGLLHDIGKLVLLKLQRDYVNVGGQPPTTPELETFVRQHHASVGAEVLQFWNLPARLLEPIRFHHDPSAASPDSRAAACVVYIANLLSHRYGFGCQADTAITPLADSVGEALNLTPEWLDEIDQRAPGLFAVARQIVR